MISARTGGPTDVEKLRQVIASEAFDTLDAKTREAFPRMLEDIESGRFRTLTERQRDWVDGVRARLELDAGDAENLFSSGLVPIGAPVETPAVLRNLPKKPPVRK